MPENDHARASPSDPGRGLSVVIPAFNEAPRIERTLRATVGFLRTLPDPFEVLVVDDGSSDLTTDVVNGLAADLPEMRLIRLPANQGKGAAVRAGVAETRGEWVLFSDADLSTPIEEWPALRRALGAGADVAIGSREVAGAVRVVPQPWFRRALGWLFMNLRGFIILPGFIDTQCGFKAFRGPVARSAFAVSSIDGFSFDVEVLAIVVHRGQMVAEVPVHWTDDRASRVRPIRDGARMMLDLCRIRRRMRRGEYDRT
ncbi:MAG: glycosyltransferase family 2 protein [Planctomycetes bacterium]|nr:glycosyltransferase family 2 protein [Planctomycetota bacterium]